MSTDPRGSPTDHEYITHLEFFNQQRQKRIEELEKAKHETAIWKRVLFRILVRIMRVTSE